MKNRSSGISDVVFNVGEVSEAPIFSHQLRLTELESLQLKLLIEGLPSISFSREQLGKPLLAIIHQQSCYLPSRLVQFLFDFRYQPSSDGAALIQNLPVDVHNEWLLVLVMSAIADLMLHESESNYIYHFESQDSTAKTEQDYTACLLPLERGEMLLVDNQMMKNMSELFQLDGRDRPLQAVSGVRDMRRIEVGLAGEE